MSDRDPMLEISTALADLAEVMERKDGEASQAIAAAMQSAALEISTPLADLIEVLQRNGPEGAREIAKALAGLRAEAPVVNVSVPPAEVVVQMPQSNGWRFDVDYHPNGAIKGLTAKRLT